MTQKEFIAGNRHNHEIDVAWGEMDALGHVNNIFYIRYFEIARIAYFETLLDTFDLSHGGVSPILANISAQYISPVTYPDRIIVGSRIHTIGTTSLKMAHQVFSTAQHRVVCEGDSVLVMYDYNRRIKVVIPNDFREVVRDFERNPSL